MEKLEILDILGYLRDEQVMRYLKDFDYSNVLTYNVRNEDVKTK